MTCLSFTQNKVSVSTLSFSVMKGIWPDIKPGAIRRFLNVSTQKDAVSFKNIKYMLQATKAI